MKPTTVAILAGTAALTLVYLAHQAANSGVQILQTIGDAVDPTNPRNVVASGINKVGTVLVQDPYGPGKNADGSWTFGGYLYDVFNPEMAYLRDHVTDSTNATATSFW